jgi:hypothetical protein
MNSSESTDGKDLSPELEANESELDKVINEVTDNPQDAEDARAFCESSLAESMTQDEFDKGVALMTKYGDKFAGVLFLINKKKADIIALDPSMAVIEKSWTSLAPQERVQKLTDALKFRASWQMGIESALQIRNVKEAGRGAARMGLYIVKDDILSADILSPEMLFFTAYSGILKTDEAELEQALKNYAESTGLRDVAEPAIKVVGKVNANVKTLGLMMKLGDKKEAVYLQSLAQVRAERNEQRRINTEIQAFHDAEVEASSDEGGIALAA